MNTDLDMPGLSALDSPEDKALSCLALCLDQLVTAPQQNLGK